MPTPAETAAKVLGEVPTLATETTTAKTDKRAQAAAVQAAMAALVMVLMGYTFTTANATQVLYQTVQTEPQVTTVQTALTET